MIFRRLALVAALSAAVTGSAFAQSNNPDFRLNNRSGQTINEVYVSSSNVNSWGRDRLGDNVLPSGQSLEISLPAGQCMNDIRVVLASGQALERRGVNTCNLQDFDINP
ncbi:hypothetical protein [Muricoccus radiodurans]|uniref:hypothetical protein n=1 Tax=Muricoccus radiodurans TaxID=2231721 RepID=UPI003CF4E2FA